MKVVVITTCIRVIEMPDEFIQKEFDGSDQDGMQHIKEQEQDAIKYWTEKPSDIDGNPTYGEMEVNTLVHKLPNG